MPLLLSMILDCCIKEYACLSAGQPFLLHAGTAGVCLVLGNESQGLSKEACARCQPLSIPMAGRMESLNVSHAGAILMFALSKAGPQVLKSAHQYVAG